MLTLTPRATRHAYSRQQRGVVLVIALIVLVAMSMAGIALVRSVDTTTLIAGNLAFKQATVHAGDAGVNDALTWMQTPGTILFTDDPNAGYIASCPLVVGVGHVACSPTNNQWQSWWNSQKIAGLLPGGVPPKELLTDAAGNQVSYLIQRMCQSLGTLAVTDPHYGDPAVPNGATDCARYTSTTGTTDGSTHAVVRINEGFTSNSLLYYRITARITGPNNTVSFIQAFVAQ
jgi:type IV pilus assembly protein PilX